MNHMFGGGLEGKRAACVWHRRAGKDSCCLNLSAIASQMRVGTIWHMLPTLKQGRRVIWENIDKYGRPMVDQAFPPEMVEAKNSSEMSVKMKNGSIYQVVGSDNYDSLVGTNPVGVIFSEWSIADPHAWDYIRPILRENGGWALFIYTYRGKNHGYQTYQNFTEQMEKGNKSYFTSILTVDDTKYPDGTPIISPEAVEEERATGMSDAMIQQEYYCSPDAGLEGAFFTNELLLAEKEGRIGDYPWNPHKSVQTFWDLGFRDKTSVGFTQRHESGAPIFIDHMSKRNVPLDVWIKDIRSMPYDYDSHHGPHDLEQHEFSSGKTRLEFAHDLGFSFDVVEKVPVADGIDQVRKLLRTAYFHRPMVAGMLNSLASYRREYDDRLQIYRDKPLHDWSSHDADMVRYCAVDWNYEGGATTRSVSSFHAIRAVRDNPYNDSNNFSDIGAVPSVTRSV